METFLKRFNGGIYDTIGMFLIETQFQCFTLEDEFRTIKVKGDTRVPAGRYEIKLRKEGGFHEKYLAKFGPAFHKGMLHITNIPDFEFILIHIGNDEDDTAGCPLVGNTVTQNVTGKGYLADSESAYKRIYPKIVDKLISGERVFITIQDFS